MTGSGTAPPGHDARIVDSNPAAGSAVAGRAIDPSGDSSRNSDTDAADRSGTGLEDEEVLSPFEVRGPSEMRVVQDPFESRPKDERVEMMKRK